MDAINDKFESVKSPMSFPSLSCGLAVLVHARTVPEQNVPKVAENKKNIRNVAYLFIHMYNKHVNLHIYM